MQQTKSDASYGIIPIRRAGDSWEVFLIHQYSRIGNNTYWALPKGHPEKGETPREIALRELKEETGMTPAQLLLEPAFSVQYNFIFDDTKINKTVTFFIGIITSDTVVLNGEEVKEAGWYSLAEAAARLDYKDMKNLFAEATRYIQTLGQPDYM